MQVCNTGGPTSKEAGLQRIQMATGFIQAGKTLEGILGISVTLRSSVDNSRVGGGSGHLHLAPHLKVWLYLDKGNQPVFLSSRCRCNLWHLISVHHVHVGRWACFFCFTVEEPGEQGVRGMCVYPELFNSGV